MNNHHNRDNKAPISHEDMVEGFRTGRFGWESSNKRDAEPDDEDDSFIENYMAFKSMDWFLTHYEYKRDKVIAWGKETGFRNRRAQNLLDKLDDLDKEFPALIKEAIWKLEIIRRLAQLFASDNIEDYNRLEKISNHAIKARLEDYSTWDRFEDVIVVENDGKPSVEWVAVIAESNLFELEKYARTLMDKVSLKDNVKEKIIYNDWATHVVRCRVMNIDPKDLTEQERIELEQDLDEMGKLPKELRND